MIFLRAKAKKGLLDAKKNGELEALAEEMDAIARQKEQLATAKAEARAAPDSPWQAGPPVRRRVVHALKKFETCVTSIF